MPYEYPLQALTGSGTCGMPCTRVNNHGRRYQYTMVITFVLECITMDVDIDTPWL